MSRTVPWRNKPSPFLLQMVEEVKNYKLYLVNELGPTSFVFKDDRDNKFKVSIGGKLSCSCGVVQNDHCLHTLYVLLKKYRVDQHNPILWQASYLDSELEGLVQYKYSAKRKPQAVHQYLRKQVEPLKDERVQEDDFPEVGEDDSCPICYEVLKGECYSQCQECRNCIHTKCLKVWVKHKQESAAPVTCPMCRNEFHNPIGMILKDTEKWSSRFLVHKGIKCIGCNIKNIKGMLFHCLICPQANLCRLCFEDGQHPEHQHFFMKQQSDSKWLKAPERESLQNRIPVYKTIQQRPQDKIEKVLEAGLPLPDALMTMLALFPSLKQLQSQSILSLGQLNIVGSEVKAKNICCKCSQLGNDSMRKLTCGHTVHQECLEKMVDKLDFECGIDGELIAQGYLSALDIKPSKRIKKAMVTINSNAKNNPFRQQLEEQKLQEPRLAFGQNTITGMQPTSVAFKANKTSKNEKPSYNLRSNSLRKRVEVNRHQPENFLLGNSNPVMMVTGLHALPPSQPRTRSSLKPPYF